MGLLVRGCATSIATKAPVRHRQSVTPFINASTLQAYGVFDYSVTVLKPVTQFILSACRDTEGCRDTLLTIFWIAQRESYLGNTDNPAVKYRLLVCRPKTFALGRVVYSRD